VPTQPLYEIYLEDKKHHEAYNDLVEISTAGLSQKRPQDFVELFIEPAASRNAARRPPAGAA